VQKKKKEYESSSDEEGKRIVKTEKEKRNEELV
jgi:hypothetical protein